MPIPNPDLTPQPSPGLRVGRQLLLGILWVTLAIYFLTPVNRVLQPDLDSSIHATYGYFTAHHFQFGPQVNTTAGPYGFVMFGSDYGGELYWIRFFLEFAFTLGLSALVLWFLCAAPRTSPWHWAWLATGVIALDIGDNLYTSCILLCGIYLILSYQRPASFRASIATAVFLSFLSLVKGTQLAEAFGALLCVAVMALLTRSWLRAFWIAGSFLLGLLGWWLLAGQNPLHLPAYIQAIRYIAQGYNEAMALETPTRLLEIGSAMALSLLAMLTWTAARRRASPAMVSCCLLLAGFTYVSWKHGYVRSDGHMYIFMDFAWVAAFTVPMLERIIGFQQRNPVAKVVGVLFPIVVAAFSLAGSSELLPNRPSLMLQSVGPRLVRNFDAVVHAAQHQAQYESDLAVERIAADLPAVRHAVGRRSIDFFGHEIGLLLLNGLNYQPTPMCCGTYHVYNPYFKALNYEHFLDPARRPDFLLMKLQSIDDRFIPIDDSSSLLAILNLYRPVFTEDLAMLLEAMPGPVKVPAPQLLSTHQVRFDEDIVVPAVEPGQMLLFSLNLPSNLRGDLLALAYKPPLIFMDLQGTGLLRTRNQRIIASSALVPSLLNPTLEENPDLIDLLSGSPGKHVEKLRLHTPEPGCFKSDELSISFYSVPRPPISVAKPFTRFSATAVFLEDPEFIEPFQALTPLYNRQRVVYLPSPGRIGFKLRGTERELDVRIGILDSAYLEGRTNGVTFTIELEQPGTGLQVLGHRVLQPRTVMADRGVHQLHIQLPAAFRPGSRIIIHTDPVGDGGNAWGWAFLAKVRFVRGAFMTAQFPGFKTLPVAVESASCGLTRGPDREVFFASAPSTLEFELKPGPHEVRLTGGLLPGSYTLGGRTDGAEFIVESRRPDGTVATLFQRWLRPLTNPADRGEQAMQFTLSPQPAGSRLLLRITPGPNQDDSWDWTYVSGFELR